MGSMFVDLSENAVKVKSRQERALGNSVEIESLMKILIDINLGSNDPLIYFRCKVHFLKIKNNKPLM